MKSKTFLKSALMATTFLCVSAYSYADSAVEVTDADTTTTTTTPIQSTDSTASSVATDTSADTTSSTTTGSESSTTPSNIVVQTTNPGAVVVKHHHQRGYLNGYKGYRHPRPHYYRYTDGWYYPDAAFKDTDGAVDRTSRSEDSVNSLPTKHLRYCRSHYRSYRVSDNSFQPYHGPRQQCYSRYYRGNN